MKLTDAYEMVLIANQLPYDVDQVMLDFKVARNPHNHRFIRFDAYRDLACLFARRARMAADYCGSVANKIAMTSASHRLMAASQLCSARANAMARAAA